MSAPGDDPLAADQKVMARLAAGETAPIIELYDRYGSLVYSVVYGIVGDEALTEELVQEVFLRVWRSAASYRSESGPVRAWLLMIARHRAIDEWRRLRRERNWISLEAVASGWRLTNEDRVSDPFLYEAMSQLPTEQQQVVELAYYAGLTVPEIAERLGLPPGTVKSRLRLAMVKLRARLDDPTDNSP
jgi:RNA polymerase sigma-70 factor (ECF subfamily)